MIVSKLMSKSIVTVELDEALRVVKKIFDQAKFHHLLVVEKNVLYGVISDRDLFKAISPHIGTPEETLNDTLTLSKKVHQIMTRKLITLPQTANVYDAIHLFNQHNISCIPIVDEQKRPVGIVSWRDILRAIEANHNKKAGKSA